MLWIHMGEFGVVTGVIHCRHLAPDLSAAGSYMQPQFPEPRSLRNLATFFSKPPLCL